MGGRIFINYRREDSAADALAIASYLGSKFGPNRVFIDVDRLRPGEIFQEQLENRLATCTVMLTLIGPKWIDVTNLAGERRLDDPQDWVRLEIERALARKIVVIPVLTGGASLPKAADLPEGLKPLIERHAAVVRTNSFRTDMAGLVRDMGEVMRGPRLGYLSAAAAALALTAIGIFAIGQPETTLPPTQQAVNESEVRGARNTVEEPALRAPQAEGSVQIAELKAASERKAAQEVAEKKRAEDAQRLVAATQFPPSISEPVSQKAAPVFQTPQHPEPEDAYAYNSRGDDYFDRKDYNRAIVAYTRAIELDPEYGLAYYNRGAAYHEKKNYDRAIADYTKDIELNPKHTKAYNNRGVTYYRKRAYDSAIADFTKALELEPSFAVAYYNRGNAYNAQGNASQADADYKTAKELGYKG